MVGTLNKVILIGNVGKDPEIRVTQEGKEIASFSLATSESWKDKVTGERKEKTEWHKVVVFVPQLVDIIKRFLKKGGKVYVEGSLQTRRWMDQGSVEKYVTEVLLQSFNSVLMLLDSRGSQSAEHGGDSASAYGAAWQQGKNSTATRLQDEHSEGGFDIEEMKDEDIPF